MADEVECAQCGSRYDSEMNPFCPQCGSTRDAGLEGAVAASRRTDPRRRRLQAGGLVLLVLGLVWLVGPLMVMVAPLTALEQVAPALEEGTGGVLVVRVEEGGRAVEGATVVLRDLGGQALHEGRTDGLGELRHALDDRAAVRVEVAHGAKTWTRTAIVPAEEEVVATVDLTDAPGHALVAPASLVSGVRAFAILLGSLAALVVAGGVAAVRVRHRGLATAGAAAAVLPAVVVTATNAIGFLFLVPASVAALLIVLNRDQF